MTSPKTRGNLHTVLEEIREAESHLESAESPSLPHPHAHVLAHIAAAKTILEETISELASVTSSIVLVRRGLDCAEASRASPKSTTCLVEDLNRLSYQLQSFTDEKAFPVGKPERPLSGNRRCWSSQNGGVALERMTDDHLGHVVQRIESVFDYPHSNKGVRKRWAGWLSDLEKELEFRLNHMWEEERRDSDLLCRLKDVQFCRRQAAKEEIDNG